MFVLLPYKKKQFKTNEGKFTCVQCNVKARRDSMANSRGIAPHSLNIGTRYSWVFGLTPRPLYCRGTLRSRYNIGCPTRYRTRLAGGPMLRVATIMLTTDSFIFIYHSTNVLLFKFRCNIFIGVRIIKEMSGSVASGTNCRTRGWSQSQSGRFEEEENLLSLPGVEDKKIS
jgi:hypothetical protein